jgi:hypothetical protein
VIGRPSEFTREWAYTALTRARHKTSIHLIAEPTAGQRDREQYAPPEPQRTRAEALDTLSRTMRRSEAEPLAIAQNQTAELLAPTGPRPHGSRSPSCPRPAPSASPITTSATSQRLPDPTGARKHATGITAATTATPMNASPSTRKLTLASRQLVPARGFGPTAAFV